jgi:hypothetical protein
MVDIRRPDGFALASGRLHFSCMQFTYQGLAHRNHSNCLPDGWSDACNFHIWSLSVVRTVEICMHDLPYGGHRPYGFCRLPIRTVSLERWILLELWSRTICHYVRTDVTLNSSKFLDAKGRLDDIATSSGQMLLTDEHPDGLQGRPDGFFGSNFYELESA